MYDVLVVGAGPAGSYLAGELASAGHRVAVLEKRTGTGWKGSCTGLISRECAERFAVSPHLILKSIRSARLISPGGAVLDIARPETQAVMIDRATFDTWLADRARRSGAEYHFETTVMGLERRRDSVEAYALSRGEAVRFEARAAVIACGYNPPLLRQLGFEGFRDFAIGAQVTAASAADDVHVFFGRDVAPHFFAWLVPGRPGFARVGLLSRTGTARYLVRFLARLQQEGLIERGQTIPSFGAVPLHALKRTYGSRVLIIGDAAGHVKPVTGGGIYFGLLGAEAAAQTLNGALAEGDLAAPRLAGYERAWRGAFAADLRSGYWARRIFDRVGDEGIDRVFRALKATGLDRAILEKKELSFDRNGALALALVGNSILSRVMGAVKPPGRRGLTGKGRNGYNEADSNRCGGL